MTHNALGGHQPAEVLPAPVAGGTLLHRSQGRGDPVRQGVTAVRTDVGGVTCSRS